VLLFAQVVSSGDVPDVLEPPIEETVEAPVPALLPDTPTVSSPSPKAYLYSAYPALARRFDCVIQRESRWDPSAQNPRSGAAGLTQMLLSTWMTTPSGKRGESRFNAFSNIDGAAWLVTSGGGWRHWAATVGGC
jgi:hypothetical protein